MTKINESYISTTIEKAIEILKLFKHNKKLSFTEILNKVSFSKSTLYRVLYTLEVHDFLKKDKNGRYSLGIEPFILGNSLSRSNKIRDVAAPYMRKLTEEIRLTTQLGILEGTSVVIIHKENPVDTIKMYSRMGKEVPAHCTGQGKTLLAFSSEDKVEQIIENKGLKKFNENTITTRRGLEKELHKIRVRGYTIDNSEHEKHIKCVAVPIMNKDEKAEAALSITGLTVDFDEEGITKRYAKKLKKIAQKVQKELGMNFLI